jgi:hypothetical protein
MFQLKDDIASLIPSSLADKLLGFRKASMLTSPATHLVNVASDSTMGALEIAKDILAAAVDATISALYNTPRTTTFTLRGLPSGIWEGIQKAGQLLKTGYDPRGAFAKYDYKKINYGNSLLGRTIGNYEKLIFRSMGAGDMPFYYGQKSRSIYEQAIVAAKNARKDWIKNGRKTKFDYNKTIDDLVVNPTDKMILNATNDAEMAVFQNETVIGNVGAELARKAGPVGQFIAPFTKTPAAVAMQTVNYTPFGVAKTIIEQIQKRNFDQRAFAKSMGRNITGTGVFAIGAQLRKHGYINLGYPKSEKEKALWDLEGRIPWSIRIGNRNYSLASAGIPGIVMMIGGSYYDGYEETGSKTEGLSKALFDTGRVQTEQTYLRGVKGFIDAIGDGDRYGASLAGATAASTVPSIVAAGARAIDPLQRDIKDQSFVGAASKSFAARVPIMREKLQPKRDAFGKEIERPTSALIAAFDFLRTSPVKGGEIVKELRRLNDTKYSAVPSIIKSKERVYGKEIEIPEDALDELKAKIGKATERSFQVLMNRDDYKTYYDDEAKQNILNKTSDEIKKLEIYKYAKENKLVDEKRIELFGKEILGEENLHKKEYLEYGIMNTPELEVKGLRERLRIEKYLGEKRVQKIPER